MKEAASRGGLSTLTQTCGVLLKLGRNACERSVKLSAHAIDSCDDHNGNPTGDQSVLDSGSAGLVLQKRNNLRHESAPVGLVSHLETVLSSHVAFKEGVFRSIQLVE